MGLERQGQRGQCDTIGPCEFIESFIEFLERIGATTRPERARRPAICHPNRNMSLFNQSLHFSNDAYFQLYQAVLQEREACRENSGISFIAAL